MARALCLLLVLSGSAFGSPDLTGRRVRRVDLHGATAFDHDDLRGKLETRPPRGFLVEEHTRYDPAVVEVDRRRIEAFYAERGWFEARVERVAVRPAPKGSVDVAFHLREGRPTRIASVTPAVPGLRVGDPIVYARYEAAKEAIEDDWIRRGYPHVRVDGEVRVDRARRTADVVFTVDSGPEAIFRSIAIAGETRVPTESILARVEFQTGDRFDPEALRVTQSRLLALGTFSAVRIDWAREGRPREIDVTIHLTDGLRHELRAGGGVAFDSARLDVRARMRYQEATAFDPLLSWWADARPGYTVVALPGGDAAQAPTLEGGVGLARADFLAPLVTGEVAVTGEYQVYDAWRAWGPSGRLTLDRPFFRDRLTVSGGWRYRHLWLSEDEAGVLGGLGVESPYRLAFFEQRVALDLRDAPLRATRGLYAEMALEQGGLLGDYEYLRMTPELRGYVPVGSRMVLAARGRAGLLEGDDSPLTQRFFGGGAAGHRGFGFRRLAPQILTDSGRRVPVGGNAMVETSVEARVDMFRFYGDWGGVVFVDGADVRPRAEDLDLDALHWAAGLGLRYKTPFGPIRADVGFRLNRLEEAGPTGVDNPDPGNRWEGHLSFGEAF